jgi:WD40 repeat protein/DNA-binding winged helix-turn-helix (wHTH) protein
MSLIFGKCELDQERRQLLRSGQPVPLEPKAYELLSLLVERRPRVLSRAQIRDVVWPGVFISESTLNQAVNNIRQALDDDARQPRFVRTAHGFGYAFCGEAHDTTQGPPGAGEQSDQERQSSPYPGLRAFTEADAPYLFGREDEVKALWEKVGQHRLVAVIGPSGVGKTSFLRAGVLASKPTGWGAVYATPGSSPAVSLARALTPHLAGDVEAMSELLEGVRETAEGDAGLAIVSAVAKWRRKHAQVLVVLDQFEELFTQNGAGVASRFASLVGGLAAEADVHVVLGLRDDFLFRCGEHEALRPVFRDLTPLYPPTPEALRRALVEPAARLGFRFEDEALVDEMIDELQQERGALPLLAFAASRLWERRDREKSLLTRDAYREIGGVAGALAQHAEETLGQTGPAREPLVREIFRNLVTVQGTRAVREREELLSVFGPGGAQPEGRRDEAEGVLRALVDARLLTQYELAGDGGESHTQVEIIHESLLTAWPRLVRWQTQDKDGAQLRDQLRRAAQLWHDRGRTEDLLWSGTAYQDFALWRQRHRVSLTDTEDAFARAMEANATRRRRRRRTAAVTLVGFAAAVAIVTTVLWQRSEASRHTAEAETRRAEASKVVALGQLEIDRDPTAALAYAIASIELADTGVGRLFALRALQRGPIATLTPVRPPGQAGIRSFGPAFSPDGEWLALGGFTRVQVFHRDGRAPLLLGDYALAGAKQVRVGFGPGSDILVANREGDVRVWSIPEGRELRRGVFEQGPSGLAVGDDGFLTLTTAGGRQVFRRWPFAEGEPRLIGSMEPIRAGDIGGNLGVLVYFLGRKVYLRSVQDWASPPQLVAELPADVYWVTLSRDGRRLAASDASGEIQVWPIATRSPTPLRVLESKDTYGLRFDPTGKRLAGIVAGERGRWTAGLWDLTAPPGAEPRVMRRGGWLSDPDELAFDPSGRWVVTTYGPDAAFWSLEENPPLVLAGHQGSVMSVAFTPDGRGLVSASQDGTVRTWPLSADTTQTGRVLMKGSLRFPALAIDSASRQVAVVDGLGHVLVVPLAGGPVRELAGLPSNVAGCVAFSERGLLAAAPYGGRPEQKLIRVWDLETGAVRVLPPVPGALEGTEGWAFDNLRFLGPDRLLTSVVRKGLLLYDLRSETGRALAGPSGPFAMHRDALLGMGLSVRPESAPGQPSELVRFRLDATKPETVRTHGSRLGAVALDPTGAWVATGGIDGIVRIGPVTGEEPHVFLGHEGQVWTIAFSPDGRWVASAGDDQTIRLWPVPDASKPPLHTRPHAELLAVLRSHTNLRAVPDAESATGWQLARDPFPGWARLPER